MGDKIKQLEKEIEKLREEVKYLRERRVSQHMVMPLAIKSRHMGEGIKFIQTGLAADRPTTPEEPTDSAMIYFAHDTNVLSIWDVGSDAWRTVTLS